jgi:hypothetical protein
MRVHTGLLPFVLAAAGCINLGSNQPSITYDLDAQEFMPPDFGNQMGKVPTVDCTANAGVCAAVQAPPGTTATCEAASHLCVIQADVRLIQTIDLSKQKGFPSSVANTSLIHHVEVNEVRYWTPTNTLSFATPPINISIGSQTVQSETDPGATQLGTLPSLAAMTVTACHGGTPGTPNGACLMPLTDAGKMVLGRLAKDYKTPFNVIVSAHLVAHAGDPVPAGRLDIFVQPEIAFVLFQ